MSRKLVTTGWVQYLLQRMRVMVTMFRVNYDKKNWELIRQQLIKDHTAIHVINRAQILNDALNLAKSDHLDYETALGLTEYLSNEMEYIPWSAALTGT